MSNNPLDNPKLDVKNYFNEYIKNKSISQLLEQDNKVFSEIKALENEKHILVTQNYKRFVSATETINTVSSILNYYYVQIKHSLFDFEKDLSSLQSTIGKLVDSFNSVNDKVDPLVQKANNVFKIKKDLKRLKFINDLPNKLEDAYNSYLKTENKDLSIFENALNYYQKCKDFIYLHKDNVSK